MKRSVFLSLTLCFLFPSLPLARAQQPGSSDPAFKPGKFDQQILQVLARPDGTALVAGYFSHYNGTPVGPIVQLQRDGTLDPNFANANTDYLPAGESINSVVLATDPSGRILVSLFTAPSYKASLVRLNPGGTLDPTFHATVDGPPGAIVPLPNGQILIAGGFRTLNGLYQAADLARLNQDGSTDTTFDPGPRAGIASFAYAFTNFLVVQPDGKIIIGGGVFPTYDAAITRLNPDGSRDTTFALVDLPSTTLQGMALQPGGGLIVSYNTASFNGEPYPYIARLKTNSADGTDGQLDPAFQPPASLDTFPRSTLVQADGKIVLSLGGSVIRLNADGGVDSGFSFAPLENSSFGLVLAQTASGDLLLAYMPGSDSYTDGIAALRSAAGGDGGGGGNDGAVHVAVPGTADVWLAGQPTGAITIGQDVAPTASPVLVADLKFDENHSLAFSATGGTGNGLFTSTSPDGATNAYADHPAEKGFAALSAPTNSLVGIFLSDKLPAPGNNSASKLNYHSGGNIPGGVDFSGYRPALNTPFFIGDGQDANGNPQQIYPPHGATRLYLGSLDAQGNTDNPGQFNVAITAGGYDASDVRLSQGASAGGVTGGGNDAAVAFLGNTITYTYTIGNFRDDHPLLDAVLVAGLPAHTTFVSTNGTGGIYNGNGSVVWSLPIIPRNIGQPYQVSLTVRVNLDSPLEQTITDDQVFLYASHYPAVQVNNRQPIILRGPIGFAVTTSPATASPNNPLTFTFAVTNTSYGTINGAKITVPIPDAVAANFKEAYFLDKRGVRVNATRQGNKLVFKTVDISSGATLKLFLTVTVPGDIDRTQPITISGASIDIPNRGTSDAVFFAADFSTKVSAGSSAPRISFAKAVIDPMSLIQLGASQPNLSKGLAKLLPAVASDPTLLAAFEKIYPGLVSLNPASATIDEILAALNPDVSYTSASDVPGRSTILTVDAPASPQKETYASFVLGFSNSGNASVKAVAVTDRVPEGMSILDPDGGFNGSVIINGKLGSPALGNVRLSDGGRGLTFQAGDLPAGGSGYIIYKLRLLTAGEPGSLKDGDVVSTGGSNLSAANLSRQYIGQPDGQDLEVIGKYAYFFESDQLANTPETSDKVIYALRYRNTGNKASKILEIEDPVPSGLSLLDVHAYDLDGNPLSTTEDGAVVRPADPARGTLLLRPPLMTGKGKVLVGDGGTIIVRYKQLGTGKSYLHQPKIAAGSYGNTAAFAGGEIAHAVTAAGSPVRHAASAGEGVGGFNTTRVDAPALARVFLASAVPMNMVEGQDSDLFLVVGSTNDTGITSPNINFTLPKGFDVELIKTDAGYSIAKSKDSLGNTQIALLPQVEIAGHSSLLIGMTVRPRAGFASQTPVVFPNFSLGQNRDKPLLQTGPVNVRVMTPTEFDTFSALQSQVANSALTYLGAPSPKLREFVSHVGKVSRTIIITGAGNLAGTNGAAIVPLLGSPEDILALGPSTAVGTDVLVNGPDYQQDHDGSFTVISGRADQIQIGAAAANSGSTSPQKAAAILAAIRGGEGGNAVKRGAFTIQHNGGSNLLANDGLHLIGQDGNGLDTTLDQVVSSRAARAAASRANADTVISRDGAGLIGQDGNGLIGQDGNGLIGQDGNGLIATRGGGALASGGASIIGENGSGIIGEHGSGIIGENGSGLQPSSETGISAVATPSGNLIQSGSVTGIIGENGSGLR